MKKEMFCIPMEWALNKELRYALPLLAAIDKHKEADGFTYVNNRILSIETGLQTQTISAMVISLGEKGFLQIERKKTHKIDVGRRMRIAR